MKHAGERVTAAAGVLRDARMRQDKEAAERDGAARAVLDWIQEWRPIALLELDGAATNIRSLPAGAATPDQLATVAESLAAVFGAAPGEGGEPAGFAVDALADLGTKAADLRKEASEANSALTAENAAEEEYADACDAANRIIIRATQAIRAAFGPTSWEYRRLVGRSTTAEQDAEDAVVAEPDEPSPAPVP